MNGAQHGAKFLGLDVELMRGRTGAVLEREEDLEPELGDVHVVHRGRETGRELPSGPRSACRAKLSRLTGAGSEEGRLRDSPEGVLFQGQAETKDFHRKLPRPTAELVIKNHEGRAVQDARQPRDHAKWL